MTSLASRIRINVIYGIIVLVPVAVLLLLAFKVFEMLQAVSKPMSEYFGIGSLWANAGILLLAALLLLVICFAMGAAVRTQIGSWSFEKLEARVLRHVPFYEILGNLLRGFADRQETYRPALVTLHAPGTAVLGFVVEGADAPYATVFVPSAPMMTVGSVHVVERGRVRLLEASTMDAANCIGQWGIGLGAVLGDTEPRRVP